MPLPNRRFTLFIDKTNSLASSKLCCVRRPPSKREELGGSHLDLGLQLYSTAWHPHLSTTTTTAVIMAMPMTAMRMIDMSDWLMKDNLHPLSFDPNLLTLPSSLYSLSSYLPNPLSYIISTSLLLTSFPHWLWLIGLFWQIWQVMWILLSIWWLWWSWDCWDCSLSENTWWVWSKLPSSGEIVYAIQPMSIKVELSNFLLLQYSMVKMTIREMQPNMMQHNAAQHDDHWL